MSADRRARFEVTALPHLRRVHYAALHLSRPDEARDLVQETFLRAYRTFDGFTPGTNARAWLLKHQNTNARRGLLAGGNWIVDQVKLIDVYPQPEQLGNIRAQSQGTGGAPYNVLVGLARAGAPYGSRDWEGLPAAAGPEVERALAGLPESYRDAVLLVDVQELTYEEAAAVLDCPIGTVRSRLFRARKLLFAALYDYARQAGYLKEPPAR